MKNCLYLIILCSLMGCVRNFTVPKEILVKNIPTEDSYWKMATEKCTPDAKNVEVELNRTVKELKRNNKIKWLTAYDKKGQLIDVKINPQSKLTLKTKDNEKVSMVFCTIYCRDNVLYGKYSVLLNINVSVPIDKIESATLYTENSSTRKHVEETIPQQNP